MHARKVPSFVLQRQHSFPSRASSFAHSPSQSQRKTHDQTLDSGYVEVTQTTGYRAALQFKIRRLLQSEYFERFMLLFIIVNCILLGFESNHPAFQDSRLGQSLQILEFVFLSIFSIEMTLKIIAFGFLMAPGSYLRDGIATNHSCSLTSFSSGWNVLDFTVIVLGWVAFSPSVGNYSALRAVRVLRSLRTITGIPGMRVRNPSIVLKTLSLCVQKLVLTLLQSLPMLLDVGILCAFAYFVFGIIGVQLFSGALDNQCGCPLLEGSSFGNGSLSQVCRGRYSDEIHWTIVDGKLYGENEHSDLVESYHCSTRVTEDCPNGLLCAHTGNPNYGITNFDNILSSWLTIFQIISMEGWTTIMYQVQDAVGQISWVYFFILIITGSLFAVNLALAVLYLHFTNSESKSEDEEVSSGCSMRSTIGSSSDSHSLELPFEDKNWLRKQCTKIRQSEVVESLTMFLIVFNVVVMAAEHHGMPSWQQSLSEYTNTVVAIYFFIEMIVKIISFGWFNFIADKSNLFDGVIAVAGLIELVISSLTNGSGLRGSIYVLRVFRLLRIFKLSRSWRELNKIVSTVHGSVSSMANLVLIFFLFIMIMALLGMQLFGFKLHSCQVPEAVSICPPGIVDNLRKTGHCDCYVPCQASQKGTWISIYDSVYNHQGYCEEFPREASESTTPEFWAQVGPAIVPRHNFDDFFMASLTVFQILTGENWNEVLYDLIHSTSYFAAIYCGVVILIGNYILLNLFLAILLDNFAGTNGTNDSDEMQLVDESKEEDASSTVSFSSTQDVHIETSKVTENQDYVEEESRLVGYSLFLFSPTNQLRVALDRVVSHWLFEYVIMVIIFFSSVMLILESPEPRDGTPLADFVYIGDRVLNLLFGMEALMKIIVLGFCFNGPRSYLRDYWNVLDFVILIIGVYFVYLGEFSDSFEVLRALRALRENNATRGGAIYANRNIQLTITDSNCTKNNATRGGCLFGDRSSLDFKRCECIENSSHRSGGCLHMEACSTNLRSNKLSLNKAKNGGGIYATLRTFLQINQTHFSSNLAENNGGGVVIIDDSQLLCLSCTFENNTANQGGGLYIASNAMEILIAQLTNSTFRNNNASSYGGGILVKTFGIRNLNCTKIKSPCDRVVLFGVKFETNVARFSSIIMATTPENILVSCFGNFFMAQSLISREGIKIATANNTLNKLSDEELCSSWVKGWRLIDDREVAIGTFGHTLNLTTNSTSGLPIKIIGTRGFELDVVRGTREFPTIIIIAVDAFGNDHVPLLFENEALELSSPNGCIQKLAIFFYENLIGTIPNIFNDISMLTCIVDITSKEEDILQSIALIVHSKECGIKEIPSRDKTSCTKCQEDLYNFQFNEEEECVPCPRHANCTMGYIVPNEGYWHKSPCHDQVKKCTIEKACKRSGRSEVLEKLIQNVTNCNIDEITLKEYDKLQCHKGYRGPLCGSCNSKYGISTNFECLKCAHVILVILRFLGAIGYLLISAIISIKGVLPSPSNRLNEQDDWSPLLESSSTGLLESGNRNQILEEIEDENGNVVSEQLECEEKVECSNQNVEIEVRKQNLVECWKICLNFFQVTSIAASMDVKWTKKILGMLEGNKASHGGAININRNIQLTIINSSCTKNNASFGGCLYGDRSSLDFQGFECIENSSHQSGGCLYLEACITNLKSNNFCLNKAKNGGGIYATLRTFLQINQAQFRSNLAEKDGDGMVTIDDSQLLCLSWTFEQNNAIQGGGLYIAPNSTQILIAQITNSTFQNNNVSRYGGGILVKTFGIRTLNCTKIKSPCDRVVLFGVKFENNVARFSSIIMVTTPENILVNCFGDFSMAYRLIIRESIMTAIANNTLKKLDDEELCTSWVKGLHLNDDQKVTIGTFGHKLNLIANSINGSSIKVKRSSGFELNIMRGAREFPTIMLIAIDAFGHERVPLLFENEALELSSLNGCIQKLVVFFYKNLTSTISGIFEDISMLTCIVDITPNEDEILRPTALTIRSKHCGIDEDLTTDKKSCHKCQEGLYNFQPKEGCTPCPKNANCNTQYIVPNEGYKGPLCGSCKSTYGSSSNFEYLKCVQIIIVILRFLGAIAYLLIGAIVTIKGVLPSPSNQLNKQNSESPLLEPSSSTLLEDGIRSQILEEIEHENGNDISQQIACEESVERSNPSAQLHVEIEEKKQKLVECWKICLNFFQVTSTAASMDVEWTKKILGMFESLNILGAATTSSVSYSVDCLISSSSNATKAIWRLLFSLFVPNIVILLLALYWVYRCFTKHGRNRLYFSKRLLLIVVTVTYITYFDLTQVAVGVFSCVGVHEDMKLTSNAITRYWIRDTSIKCYKNTHLVLMGIALVILVLVSISFPVLCSITLSQKRDEVRDATSWTYETLGFLGGPFKKNFIYWECITMIKKALLSIIIVFSYSLGNQIQGLLILLVLVLFLYVHVVCLPYDKKYHTLNYYESGSLLISCVTYTLVQFFNVEKCSQIIRSIVSLLLLAINGGFVCIMAFKIVREATNLVRAFLNSKNIRIPEKANIVTLLRVYSKVKRSGFSSA
eukprot:g3829.t1